MFFRHALVLGFGFMLIHSIMFFKNVITKKDYFHEIPIYENIYKIDALEDQVQSALEYQQEKEKENKGGKL